MRRLYPDADCRLGIGLPHESAHCLSQSSDTEFRLPSLTLQPIVENAVKYGVDPELNPLYIYVRTRETGSGHEITVEDTGPVFGESSNNEPHIALKNIRERLKIMCGGTLNIAGREQGGTVITIFVPDKK